MLNRESSIVPAIVVVGYNRPHSLERLIHSLLVADYPDDIEIPLIITIDNYHEQDVADLVKEIAYKMQWTYGNKEIICHQHRLGLKEHILRCGDLTEKYESVIVLEDDLFLSPGYYSYSSAALGLYKNDSRISGISLYAHCSNPYLREPFDPLNDGADNFFLQFASSWGQVWNKEQWSSFRGWYNKGQVVTVDDLLPDEVIAWPDTSWLKFYIKYMVETGKTFVYPRVSLSTNFGDPGTHFSDIDSFYQVPILLKSKEYNFISLDNSLSVYDSFFELETRILDKFTDRYHGKQYAIDLYGRKDPSKVRANNILTTQDCISANHTFGNVMKPALLNIVANISGGDIRFCKTNNIIERNVKNYNRYICDNNLLSKNLLIDVFSFCFGKIYKVIKRIFNSL